MAYQTFVCEGGQRKHVLDHRRLLTVTVVSKRFTHLTGLDTIKSDDGTNFRCDLIVVFQKVATESKQASSHT